MPRALNIKPKLLPPLALTMGDPAGISLDITLAVWKRRETLKLPSFAIIADPTALRERAIRLGQSNINIREIDAISEAHEVFNSALPVLPIYLKERAEPGQPNVANADATIMSIKTATQLAVDGSAAAIVTNPIAKSVLYQAGFRYPGHTEYLGFLASELKGCETYLPIMMLTSDELRIVPMTIHIPLADVPGKITADLIVATVEGLNSALQLDYGLDNPRIAIAGLNPHAGEAGTIGLEDQDIIKPTIDHLRSTGLNLQGPLPADTMFHSKARTSYDAAIAMYHDQALIPIKTLAFDRGVNVTLGLPFVRTSPDHGTAFNIAGQGNACSTSLSEALKHAAQIARQRRASIETQ